jgi:hypothetical protein
MDTFVVELSVYLHTCGTAHAAIMTRGAAGKEGLRLRLEMARAKGQPIVPRSGAAADISQMSQGSCVSNAQTVC